MSRLSILLVPFALSAPFLVVAADPAPGKQIEVKAVEGATDNPPYNYLLFLPADYEKQDKWPLMIFLHGSGERGDGNLDLVKKHGPPKIVDGKPEFEFIVVSPQVPSGGRWEPDKVVQLL